MAVVRAYAPIDMTARNTFSGQVIENTSTQIAISNGYSTSVYTGQGFTYNNFGLTGGTLTGYAEYVGGALVGEAINLNVPAVTAASLVNTNNLFALYNIALSGNDDITGSAGNDALLGFAGNDVIRAGTGTNYIDGGQGFDWAVYQNPLIGYELGIANGNLLIRSTDGLVYDTIAGVERALFADVAVAFDLAAVQTYRLYQAAFDRQPDLGGVSFWVERIDTGTSLLAAAANFIDSDEFRSLYGSAPTDEQFIDLLYENVLNRAADSGGYAYWTGRMDAGLSREAVLLEFSESPENQANTADAVRFGVVLDYG